jgi:hypothetical protein
MRLTQAGVKTRRLVILSVKQRGNKMNQNQKEQWEKIRSIGKFRYIFFWGTFFTCFQTLLITLIILYPDGEFISFNNFLFWIIVHIIAGYFWGLINWSMGEHKYKKSAETSPMDI